MDQGKRIRHQAAQPQSSGVPGDAEEQMAAALTEPKVPLWYRVRHAIVWHLWHHPRGLIWLWAQRYLALNAVHRRLGDQGQLISGLRRDLETTQQSFSRTMLVDRAAVDRLILELRRLERKLGFERQYSTATEYRLVNVNRKRPRRSH